MKQWIGLLTAITLAVGCAHLDYVGKSYPPTERVDVVYQTQDLPRGYTVIGELVATGDQLVSTSALQAKVIERAKQIGADAVLIEGLDRVVTGSSTTYTETDKDRDSRKHTTGNAVTTAHESKRIRARFIKYVNGMPESQARK